MAFSIEPQRDLNREKWGWIYLVLISILMPALFFLCVFFPIWMGWAARFP